LYRGVRVLILDEPTAVLTPQETEALFAAMRTLAGEGKAVVFVSHKLNEVLEISDRITVMRDGRVINTLESSGSSRSELAAMMLGSRALANGSAPRTPRRSAAEGAVFEARGLQVRDDRGQLAVRDVSLTVNSGEIVGVAGVSGNGQGELAEAIAGVRPCLGGRLYVGGEDLTTASVRRRIGAGLAYVPEDRLQMGVAGGLPLADNLVLRNYRARPYSRAGILRRRAIVAAATELGQRFGVRGARPGTPIRALSGGNIQRAILARELGGDPSVVVAASPTRGLDIGGIEDVHRILRDQCAGGAGVILISEDLDELLELSDRLVVLYEGRLVGELARSELDLERIGLLMAGVEAS
ncbi:MAG TPA: ATP-binding cassette domain-containing protein, partial [Thermoleophilaceae bacterium]|nr:ATP-binding cassette domain-containing protein [Thermoleophilaceae bacterium]